MSSAPGSEIRSRATATPADDSQSAARWRQASTLNDSRPDSTDHIGLSPPPPRRQLGRSQSTLPKKGREARAAGSRALPPAESRLEHPDARGRVHSIGETRQGAEVSETAGSESSSDAQRVRLAVTTPGGHIALRHAQRDRYLPVGVAVEVTQDDRPPLGGDRRGDRDAVRPDLRGRVLTSRSARPWTRSRRRPGRSPRPRRRRPAATSASARCDRTSPCRGGRSPWTGRPAAVAYWRNAAGAASTCAGSMRLLAAPPHRAAWIYSWSRPPRLSGCSGQPCIVSTVTLCRLADAHTRQEEEGGQPGEQD